MNEQPPWLRCEFCKQLGVANPLARKRQLPLRRIAQLLVEAGADPDNEPGGWHLEFVRLIEREHGISDESVSSEELPSPLGSKLAPTDTQTNAAQES